MLNFSRLFPQCSVLVAAGLLMTSAAVAGPELTLHDVRIFFDGQDEQVEILFSTSDDAVYPLDLFGNIPSSPASAFGFEGSGANQSIIRKRSISHPTLDLADTVQLRTLEAPLVSSNSLKPSGEIVLHSVTFIGDDVELVYSKGYRECVSLIAADDTTLSQFDFACSAGNMVSLTIKKTLGFIYFEVGDEVRLRTPFRHDLTTNSVIVGGAPPALACVLSEGNLSLKDRAAIYSSEIYSQGNISLSWDAKVTGNVQGAEDASLRDRAKVTGDLHLIGDRSGNGAVTGDVQESFPVPFQSLASRNVTDGGPNHTVNFDGSLTLSPGSYGNITVKDRGQLILGAAGTYRFSSLNFRYDSKLQMDTELGKFNVEIEGRLDAKDRFKVVGANGGTPDGSKISFYTNDNAIGLGYDTVMRGSLTAPNADLVLKDRATVHGCVRAENISLGYDSRITQN